MKEKRRGLILCVDDEALVLETVITQLEKEFGDHYDIEAAESGEDALEILQELEGEGYIPLVIISDWLMPGMKGDDLLIKVHQSYPQTITILLTGQAPQEAIQHAKKAANLFEYIGKPWDLSELMQSVKKGLAHYEQSNTLH